MLKFISSAGKNLLSFSFGKKAYQSFYHKLFQLSLKGMNYGNVGSGEDWLLLNQLGAQKTGRPVLFDVGANLGEYSQMAFKLLENNVEVYAFEPSVSTFTQLQKNFSPAGFKAFNVGLGDKTEQVKLYKDKDLSTIASVFQRKIADQTFEEFEVIELVSLDEFCEANGISRIDFLKIDVEGNELNVLKGSIRMLKEKRITGIQFEFGGCNIDSRVFFRDIWEILSPDYHIYRILADGLQAVSQYDEKIELFVYSNYFAKLKA